MFGMASQRFVFGFLDNPKTACLFIGLGDLGQPWHLAFCAPGLRLLEKPPRPSQPLANGQAKTPVCLDVYLCSGQVAAGPKPGVFPFLNRRERKIRPVLGFSFFSFLVWVFSRSSREKNEKDQKRESDRGVAQNKINS